MPERGLARASHHVMPAPNELGATLGGRDDILSGLTATLAGASSAGRERSACKPIRAVADCPTAGDQLDHHGRSTTAFADTE
jgi:hypothetical protein